MRFGKQLFHFITIFVLVVIFLSSFGTNTLQGEISAQTAGKVTYLPDIPAELTTRTKTENFIELTRAVPQNNASALDSIYYRLLGIKVLDPSLGNLTANVKSYWIDQVLSFRNSNGGFGGWNGDTSTISHTAKAIETLSILGYNLNDVNFNSTLTLEYVERLRNSLTQGYNSHLQDSDSDVFSTFYGIKTYNLLGQLPINDSAAADVLIRAQNLDNGLVPSVELGGFGEQTNSQKNIYWTSKISVTNVALEGASYLSTTVDDEAKAFNFTRELQAMDGGFTNDPYVFSTNVAYTASALEVMNRLGGSPTDISAAISYVQGLEFSDGGYKYQSTSSGSSLKASYFAVRALDLLGSAPTNVLQTLGYFVNWNLNTDGYGGVPGEEASLLKTFDAVAALQAMGKTPSNPQGILAYVDTYRNIDGGFGILGSYMDSTSRAVNIYNILQGTYPNPSETITFINGLLNPSGAYSKSATNTSSLVVSTYRAVSSLVLLGATPTAIQSTINYLVTCQNIDGGFGGYIGDNSDVTSSYRAIKTLSLLGDASYNIQSAKSFLQGSQIPDGGFKRSSYDNTRPNNVSHAIYTYSSVLALNYLNSTPTNVSGFYFYLTSLRNNDGGYGEHPAFTSDLSYTFTSLTLLSKYHEISGFSVELDDNLESLRPTYTSFDIIINGESLDFSVNLVNSTSEVIVNQTLTTSGSIQIDTSAWSLGLKSLHLTIVDHSGASISADFDVLIGLPQETSLSTSSSESISPTGDTPKKSSKAGFVGNTITIFTTMSLAIVASSYFRNFRKSRVSN